MSADLTIAEIERIRDGYSATGFFNDDAAYALIQHALAEPARLASAHTEGVREAIERCAAEAWRYAGFYPPHSDGRNTFAMLADCFDRWSGALSPPPEPTGGTAEPSAPVAPTTLTMLDLEDEIEEQEARIVALEAENARLREGLSKAAAQFEFYRNVHLEKCTEDGRLKAAANERMALMCRALLQGGPDAG